jgi:hypothetical protein
MMTSADLEVRWGAGDTEQGECVEVIHITPQEFTKSNRDTIIQMHSEISELRKGDVI